MPQRHAGVHGISLEEMPLFGDPHVDLSGISDTVRRCVSVASKSGGRVRGRDGVEAAKPSNQVRILTQARLLLWRSITKRRTS
jgi:hypothetical protein